MSKARDNYYNGLHDSCCEYAEAYIKELEHQKLTALKMLKDLSHSTTASFLEIDEVIKILESNSEVNKCKICSNKGGVNCFTNNIPKCFKLKGNKNEKA